MPIKKYINQAYKKLGSIDKRHETGKISKRKHDIESRKALVTLVRKVSRKK